MVAPRRAIPLHPSRPVKIDLCFSRVARLSLVYTNRILHAIRQGCGTQIPPKRSHAHCRLRDHEFGHAAPSRFSIAGLFAYPLNFLNGFLS